MSLLETIQARCRGIGLDEDDTVLDPTLASATIVSGGGERSTVRELPRISVDVRGTLPTGAATPETRVRDLEVIDTLGEGGMGRVFLARQHSLDRGHRPPRAPGDRAGPRARPDEHGNPILVMKRVLGEPWSRRLESRPHDLEDHLGAAIVALRPDQAAVVFALASGLALIVGTLAVLRSAR